MDVSSEEVSESTEKKSSTINECVEKIKLKKELSKGLALEIKRFKLK